MNLTQLRHAIFASTGGLILTSAVAVFWSLGSLDTAPQAVGQSPRAKNGENSDSMVEEPVAVSKDQFGQRLQKSLYDAPKPKPKPTPPTRPAVKPTPPVTSAKATTFGLAAGRHHHRIWEECCDHLRRIRQDGCKSRRRRSRIGAHGRFGAQNRFGESDA